MNQMCKRDSEEVLFISEWILPRPKLTVVIDQVRRLALQRDIDQESLPKQLSESNDRSALVKGCEEKMKIKTEDVIDENVEKYSKKKQTSPQKMNVSTVDETAQCVDMKKKPFQKYDSVVTVQGPLEVGGEEKPKKKTEVVNGCNIIDGNCNETNIKKTQTDIQKGTKKTSNDEKPKNKTLTNRENHQDDEKVAEQPKKLKSEIHDEKVAKKAKKEKNKVNDEKVAKKAKKEKKKILDKKVSKKAMKEKNEVHDKKMSKKASKEKNKILDKKAMKEKKKVHDEKVSKKGSKEKNEVHDEKVSKKGRKEKKKILGKKVSKKAMNETIEVHDKKVSKKPKKEKNEVHDKKVSKKPKKEKNEVHDEKVSKKASKEKNEVQDENVVKKPKKEKNEVHDENVANKPKKENNELCNEKVAKKRKKEKNEVNDDNVAKKPKKDKNEVHDEKMAKKPKKDKKKNRKDKSECKEKKVKDTATQIEHEEVWMGGKEKKVLKKPKQEPNEMSVVSAGDIKHKAKTKKNVAEQTEISIKKKTAKLKLSESEVATETSEGLCELKPKKKKKKDSSPDKEQPVDSSKAAARKQKKAAKSDVEEGETKQKGKKEKPKKRKPSGLGTDGETASVKKKKQKIEEPNCEETQHQEPNKKRKKKSPVKKVLEGVCPDSCIKKGEIQRKPKKVEEIKVESDHQWDDLRRVPQVDVVFLSEKTGNTDELTINQERRQALQMEVDKASHPQKADQASGFGQWSTAQFENCQQQQRFLRLMGGFKNFQPAAVASTPKPNMALDKVAQERLQQGLWSEFERAHSRRIDFNNQGAGLGFSKSPQKQFFIDINACHSVRFDD
ncbi:cylicin-1 [Syngnathus typhle]|uniref:cylicin-1 n=1 Tax=Syngnathus typhle TaxID=161592 RepID=UPI002A6A9244|nr:cylicin-1 [Syngnathus typhle]